MSLRDVITDDGLEAVLIETDLSPSAIRRIHTGPHRSRIEWPSTRLDDRYDLLWAEDTGYLVTPRSRWRPRGSGDR